MATSVSSELGCFANIAAALHYATITLQFSLKNIILVGQSLGTGIVSKLGSLLNKHDLHVMALCLISPFSSIRQVAKDMVGSMAQIMCPDWFNSSKYIADINDPVLFIHGKQDDLIPYTHSESLFKLCQKSSLKLVHYAEHANHNNLDMECDILWPLSVFLKQCITMNDSISQDVFDKQLSFVKSDMVLSHNSNAISIQADMQMAVPDVVHDIERALLLEFPGLLKRLDKLKNCFGI